MKSVTAPPACCPRCGFARTGEIPECARCGVVFHKLESLEAGKTAARVVEPAAEPRPISGFGRTEARMLALALLAATAANALPSVRVVLSPLVTLFHESGHTAMSWLLGHPALPAFDLVYGGGFTHEDNFKPVLALVLGAGWLVLAWIFRRNPRTLVLVGTAAVLWLIVVSAEWRRELAIAAMGHAGELILAGTFVFMALAGLGWRMPEVERPLGAFLGCFVQIHTMHFAWKLGHDADFLAWYREGKGGALMNDLESIALDLHIHTGIPLRIQDVAGALLVLSLVTFGAALAVVALRGRLRGVARSLLAIG